MAGGSLRSPKSLARADQPLAEVPQPDAIDEHPRGQRILRGRRSLAPARAGRSPSETADGRARREHAQEPPRHGLARAAGIAADEDVRLDGLRGVVHHHRPGRRTRMRRFELDDRAVQLIELPGLLLIEKLAHRVHRYAGATRRCQRALAGATPSRPPAEPTAGRRVLAECSFQRASSCAKRAAYRATTSSMFAGGPPSTDLGDQRVDREGLGVAAGWSASGELSADLAANWSLGRPAKAFQGPTTGSARLARGLEVPLPHRDQRPEPARVELAGRARVPRAWGSRDRSPDRRRP